MCIRAKKHVEATRGRARCSNVTMSRGSSRAPTFSVRLASAFLNGGTLRPGPETLAPRASSGGAVEAVRLDLNRAASLLVVVAGLSLALAGRGMYVVSGWCWMSCDRGDTGRMAT